MRTRLFVPLLIGAALVASACSSDSKDADKPAATTTTTATAAAALPAVPLVFNGQGNDLGVYLADPPYTKQLAVHHNDDEHPDGIDINGQICFDPERPERFVAGEDTHQDTTGEPGWGIFEMSGAELSELSVKQVGKLITTFQGSNDNPENYGCAFLPDGRILTTDVGNQATGPGDGQLIVWFPPFETRDVKHCKVDVELATGQGILVDGDSLYSAQARPPNAAIHRYAISDLPTSDDAAGGCDGKDKTGSPMATGVKSTVFIEPGKGNSLATPNAIAKGPNGNLFVSSVFNGVIAEFTPDGKYVRDVLKPPADEALGAEPFSTGTPLGVGVGPDGSVYYADIGIVVSENGIGPGRGTGHVRVITFDENGDPNPPKSFDEGLAFPDGIGIYTPQ